MNIELNCLVRFLNAVGGGRVSKIKGNIVYVEDEDGFEIPTPMEECIRVEEKDTFIPSYTPPKINKKDKELKKNILHKEVVSSNKEEQEFTIPEPHVLLKASGSFQAELLFLPTGSDLLSSNYELYLSNPSMYCFYFTISKETKQSSELIKHGIMKPNLAELVCKIDSQELSKFRNLKIELLAFSENPKQHKATHSINLELRLKEFRQKTKLLENDFFNEKAFIYPLIKEKDKEYFDTLGEDSKEDKKKIIDFPKKKDSLKKDQALQQKNPKQDKLNTDRNGDYVFDLHIDSLLDSTAGMDRRDILQYQIDKFQDVMKENIKHRERRIVFIHGKGDGVLRSELIKVLQKKFPKCRYRDASFSEYSYGATLVTIK